MWQSCRLEPGAGEVSKAGPSTQEGQRPHGRAKLRPATAPARVWTTLELWDFGLPAEIEVPDVEAAPDVSIPSGVWEFGTTLWRMRAEYRRRHGA